MNPAQKSGNCGGRATALVVDDEVSIQLLLREWLTAQTDLRVLTAGTRAEALKILDTTPVDILLADLRLQECSGLDVIALAREQQPHCVCVLMTGHPTLETAIRSVQSGIYDYLVKPFRMELLSATVRRAVEHRRLQCENMQLREQLAVADLIHTVGSSLEVDQIVDAVLAKTLQEFAASAASILLFDPEQARLDMLGTRGEHAVIADPDYGEFLSGNSVVATSAMTSGKPVILSDQQEEMFPRSKSNPDRICQPLMVSGRAIGLLNIVRKHNAGHCGDGTKRTLSMIASHAAITIDSARLYGHLQSAYMDTVSALANAIEIRDPYTRGHTDRVKDLARSIAGRLGWDDDQQFNMWMGCTLHDIGKLGVPDSILSKPGPLTVDEFAIMKTHPEIGVRLIEGVPCLRPALPYVFSHHERYDGTGYPTGAAGEEIPLEGRILAVVDAFDAITSNRPYRPGQPIETAVQELQTFSGRQFDPAIVKIFLNILESEDLPWVIPSRMARTNSASMNSVT